MLADEYDAAQQRGEVAGHGGGRNFKVGDGNVETTAADLGLRRDRHTPVAVCNVIAYRYTYGHDLRRTRSAILNTEGAPSSRTAVGSERA